MSGSTDPLVPVLGRLLDVDDRDPDAMLTAFEATMDGTRRPEPKYGAARMERIRWLLAALNLPDCAERCEVDYAIRQLFEPAIPDAIHELFDPLMRPAPQPRFSVVRGGKEHP